MKIRLLSDLHLEHGTAPEFTPLPDDPDSVMVLAGDIGAFRHAEQHLLPFLNMLCARFSKVLYVFGNHEFYRNTWPEAGHAFQARNDLPPNLHILNPGVVQIDDVVFVGTTLWTSFELDGESCLHDARIRMNDFRYIYTGADTIAGVAQPRLTPDAIVAEHKRQRAWLVQQLALHQAKRVVLITHHGISKQSIHARFQGNPVNGAFVTQLEPVLQTHPPVLAFHGHVHNSFDYQLLWEHGRTTRVVVNPRGYEMMQGGWENPAYDPALYVTV